MAIVRRFTKPRCLICKDTNLVISNCFGYKKFANNWIANCKSPDGGLYLFDDKGVCVESGLEDVFVYACGYVLKKFRKNNFWILETLNGQFVRKFREIKVLEPEFLAFKNANALWDILNLRYPERNLFFNLEEKRLGCFETSQKDQFVLSIGNNCVCNLVLVSAYDNCAKRKISNIENFLMMPFYRFAVTLFSTKLDNIFRVENKQLICTKVELKNQQKFDVYDSQLFPFLEGVYGFISFSNGMYLKKNKSRVWTLYGVKGDALLTDITDLKVSQNVHCDLSGMINNKHLLCIELLENDCLDCTYGNVQRIITPLGRICDYDAASPIII